LWWMRVQAYLASDEQIARELRTLGKKVYLVANKVDGVHAEAVVEFL
jgi:GTP-binding protein